MRFVPHRHPTSSPHLYWVIGNPPTENHNPLIIMTIFNSKIRLCYDERRLTDLEAVFRSLKSELGMRPVYHQKTHRVEGHIFITLLAYNLVHQIRLGLKDKGINDSWETVRTTLSTQMRTTVTVRGKEGEQIHIRKSNYPNASQQVLLRALELTWNPGKTGKTIITPKHKSSAITEHENF